MQKNVVPKKKEARLTRQELKRMKKEARVFVMEKLEYWKNFYAQNFSIHFKWNKVAIKDTKTRWGSCSSKKNLNFSYKILSLPPEGQDYLIVHELSHLIHMNHSKNFWDIVALGIPSHKDKRKLLKGYNLNY